MLGTATQSELGAFQEKVERLQTQLAQATRERNAMLAVSGGLPTLRGAAQREQYETLNARVATLQAELDALTSAAYQPVPTVDWAAALGAKQAEAIASGDDSAVTSSKYQLSDEVLASLTGGGRYSLPDDMKSAFQRALEQSAQPSSALGTQAPLTEGEPPAETGTTGGYEIDPRQNEVLTNLSFGLDPQTAMEMVYGADPLNWPTWGSSMVGRLGTTTKPTAYDEYTGVQTEKMRQDMQQQQIERDVLSGVLGGLAPSGAISPQNIQDYMGEQGVYGDITRAYYNQLTGNPSPWQMQQWEAQQQQVAADNAYRQQSLAQQAAYQQAMLEQQRREMAAQIGAQVASMANQSYMDTLGQRLPAGTQYAPGFGPTGAMASLAGMSGLPYQATQIGVANPPTTDELMKTVQDAISRF